MKLLALFLCCLTWSACQCAPLQTEVSPMRSGDTSCVGDTVKFTCTISAAAHSWRIASLNAVTVSVPVRNLTVDELGGQYFIEVISFTNNPNMVTESRLTVMSFSELNGQDIRCFDIAGAVTESQEAAAMVFDTSPPASAPRLMMAAGADLRSFDFTIIPPSRAQCVNEYFVTTTGSDGNMDTVIVRATEPLSASSSSIFNLCANMHSFTVIAMTFEGNGTVGRTSTSPSGITDIRVTNDGMGVEWTAPSNVPTTCFPQYMVNASNFIFTVNGTMVSFEDVDGFPVCDEISIVVIPIETFNGTLVGTSSATREDITISDGICLTTATTTSTTGTTTTATTAITTTTTTGGGGTGGGVSAAAVGGGVGGGIAVAVILFVAILVLVIFCWKKKKERSDKDDDIKVISRSSKEPYHSSGAPPPQTSIPLADSGAAGAMYASPDEIKHEAAGPTGDEYALVTSNTKKKSRQPAPAADTPDVGDMYSVPDKTKKKENQGLVYADIGHQPAPKKGRVVPQQPDNEPVTYATVAV